MGFRAEARWRYIIGQTNMMSRLTTPIVAMAGLASLSERGNVPEQFERLSLRRDAQCHWNSLAIMMTPIVASTPCTADVGKNSPRTPARSTGSAEDAATTPTASAARAHIHIRGTEPAAMPSPPKSSMQPTAITMRLAAGPLIVSSELLMNVVRSCANNGRENPRQRRITRGSRNAQTERQGNQEDQQAGDDVTFRGIPWPIRRVSAGGFQSWWWTWRNSAFGEVGRAASPAGAMDSAGMRRGVSQRSRRRVKRGRGSRSGP